MELARVVCNRTNGKCFVAEVSWHQEEPSDASRKNGYFFLRKPSVNEPAALGVRNSVAVSRNWLGFFAIELTANALELACKREVIALRENFLRML
jgi:hypothetical protein